jgi:hypothetical protein
MTGASTIAPDVSAVAAGFAEDRPSLIISSSAGAASIRSAHSPAPTNKKNHYSILQPYRMAVVYQAADQSRFIAS